VKQVRVKAQLQTTQEPVKPKEGAPAAAPSTETKLSKLKITDLHIGSVEAKHLIYQDEDNRIEIGGDENALPKHMKGFKALFLNNLNVWDLEWEPGKAFSQGHVSLEKYEASAGYEGLKSGMKAGVALTGGGMKAEVTGPGIFDVNIGKVEKIRGTYHDKKIDTRFATGSVVGSVAFGPDFVEARNVEVAGLNLGKASYTDGPRSLGLRHLFVEKIKLGKARQNYAVSDDPAAAGAKVPTTLTIEDIEFLDATAQGLTYDGSSTGKTADGKEVTSTQHIEGKSASIKRLNLARVDYDAEKARTALSGLKLDAGDQPKSYDHPLRIHGLAGKFVSQIADKKTTTSFLTDVEGGNLTADRITFETVTLGTAPGPDGKPQPVTRTRIDGAFHLTRLGFVNPNLTLTDEKGSTILSPEGYGTIELKDLHPRFLPNGAAVLPVDALIAKNLQVQRGSAKVSIPFAEIKDIALSLKNLGTAEGVDFLAAKLGQIRVEGLTVTIEKERKASLSDAEYDAAVRDYEEAQKQEAKSPSGKLVAEPLSDLSGEAEGEYSLDNWFDPDLKPKIKGGVVSLGGATNYAVMIEKDKLTLGNFRPKATLLDFERNLPGVYPGAGPAGYGQINIRELVEGLFNEPAGKPTRTFKPPSGLKNVRLKGSFALGEGRLGLDMDKDRKLGAGDLWVEFKRDKDLQNRIELMESNLGDFIQLEMPEFHFSGAGFTAGTTNDGKVRLGKTGDISLKHINVNISGLADFKLRITLYIGNGVIIGDLTLLDPEKLKTEAEPSATDVNPKATPRAAP
jgi:hypothetical protein